MRFIHISLLGEFAQIELDRVFKDRLDHSGLGEVIALPK